MVQDSFVINIYREYRLFRIIKPRHNNLLYLGKLKDLLAAVKARHQLLVCDHRLKHVKA